MVTPVSAAENVRVSAPVEPLTASTLTVAIVLAPPARVSVSLPEPRSTRMPLTVLERVSVLPPVVPVMVSTLVAESELAPRSHVCRILRHELCQHHAVL